MEILPREILLNIFDWIPFHDTTGLAVCKYWRITIPFSLRWQNYSRMHNSLLMILEDKKRHRYYQKIILADPWSQIETWPTIVNISDRTRLWQVGDFVDALDRIGVWGPAFVIGKKMVHSCNGFSRKYEVRFLGWTKSFDEWVSPEKITYLCKKTLNPYNLFGSIPEHKVWGLIKVDNDWSLRSFSASIDNEKKLINAEGVNIVVTPENVTEKIRLPTDINTYLCLPAGTFDDLTGKYIKLT